MGPSTSTCNEPYHHPEISNHALRPGEGGELQIVALACLQEAAWSGSGRHNDGGPGLLSTNPAKLIACSFWKFQVETLRAE
jgi:hypothetical protein